MNLEEELGPVVEPCPCPECCSISGYIYRIKHTQYRVKMSRQDGKIKCWEGCPLVDGVPLGIESFLDALPLTTIDSILFNLNLFR
jgi:hypothetical protein